MICRNSIRVFLILAAIWTGGCDSTPRGNPASKSTTASVTPKVAESPTPTPMSASPTKTWDMKAIFDGASAKTVEWPGHADWAYISFQNRDLVMHAQEPSSSATTTMRFPLRRGAYRFQTVSTLDDACTEQVALSVELTRTQGNSDLLFETTMIPGRIVPIDKSLEIDEENRELSMSVKMAPGAANSINARTRWSLMKLEYWGDAYPQTDAPAISGSQSPSTASASQGQ